jgi:hypothetical protein
MHFYSACDRCGVLWRGLAVAEVEVMVAVWLLPDE